MRPLTDVRCALALLGVAAGCTLGPDYSRPDVATPHAIAAASSASTFTEAPPWERWWEVFHDPALERLVNEARTRNEGLHAALARVQIARAIRQEASAPLFPVFGATGQYANEKQSLSAFALPGIPEVRPFTRTDFFLGSLDMAYELDLWGRVRRGLESQDAALAASVEDRKNVEITLVADVAEAYFDLGAAEARLAIARETTGLREHTLTLVQSRLRTGLATRLDVRRAEGELASAQAEVAESERRRLVAQHRLAVLLGHPPDVDFAGRPPAEFAIPPEVPVGIPSTLLERRPDVRAAEARLAAANATIGATKADYFPRVTILADVGASALDASKLAKPQSELWSVGPQISIPIFGGGRTQARVLEAEARTSEAAALYRDTVLRAFAEVADAIAGIAQRRIVRDRQAAAAAAEEAASELASSQWKDGLASYLVVLDAQRALLASRLALLEAQRALLGELVRLEKALGGGWTAPPDSKETP